MSGHQRPVGAWFFFAINVTSAAWLFGSSIVATVAPESPYAYLGGFALCPVALLYVSAELFAFLKANGAVERWLGILNLWCAAFATFALITNVGEGLRYRPGKWVQSCCEFIAVFGVIVAYLTACGLYRIRRTRSLAVPG